MRISSGPSFVWTSNELKKNHKQKYESVVKVISWRAIFPAPAVLATHNVAQQSSFSLTFVGLFHLGLGKIHIFIPDLVFIFFKHYSAKQNSFSSTFVAFWAHLIWSSFIATLVALWANCIEGLFDSVLDNVSLIWLSRFFKLFC